MFIYIIIAEFLVGVTHLFGFMIRALHLRNKPKEYRTNLKRYAIIVASYFIILFLLWFGLMEIQERHPAYGPGTLQNWAQSVFMGYLFVVPWLIAVYYWSIIYGPADKSPNVNREFVAPIT